MSNTDLPFSPMTASRFAGRVLATQCFWDNATLSDLALIEDDRGWSVQQTLGITPGDMTSGSRFRTACADREAAVREFMTVSDLMDDHIAIEGRAVAYRDRTRTLHWISPAGEHRAKPHLFVEIEAIEQALQRLQAGPHGGEVVVHGVFAAIVCSRPLPENGRAHPGWTIAPEPLGSPSIPGLGRRMLGGVHIVGRVEPAPGPQDEPESINLVP